MQYNLVMSDLKRYRENIHKKFKVWYIVGTTMAQSVGTQSSVP